MEDSTKSVLDLAQRNYTQGKELFAINVKGCSLVDILSTVLFPLLLCVIYHEVVTLLTKFRLYSKCSHRILTFIHFILEYVGIILPVLGVSTVIQARTSIYFCCCLLIVVLHIVNRIVTYDDETKKNRLNILSTGAIDSGRKGYVSLFRSIVVLYTIIAILAVDFTIFPRKYAKTYLNGFSLMDIGVGLCVIVSAIVAPMQKDLSLRSFLTSEVILFILGVVSWIFEKNTSYVVNPLEYGRDWNFYFTLLVAFSFGFTALYLTRSSLSLLLLGGGITVYYQLFLSYGLSEYLRDTQGRHFVEANASGIFSCFGFVAIYMLGAAIGRIIQDRSRPFLQLSGLWAVSGCLFWVLNRYVEAVSRRNCNAAFVALVVFIALTLLLCGYGINVFYGTIFIPLILDAYSRYQLGTYLIASGIQRVINLTIYTLFVEDGCALLILSAYLFVVSFTVCIMPK